jgi:predicted amidohydrolase YtcJ
MLERVDGHAVVVNSAALKAAGIAAATKDPVGGKIERDSNGNPTGLLIDAASELVSAKVPPPSPVQLAQALEKAQDLLIATGVTATADMGTSAADWAVMQKAAADGRLKVRIMSYSAGLKPIETIARLGPSNWLYEDRLRMGGVKLYSDGALGSRGAYLKQPYADQRDTRGLRFLTDEELRDQAGKAAALGYQIAIHAIGDGAMRRSFRPTKACPRNTAKSGAGASSISRLSIRPTFPAWRRQVSSLPCSRSIRPATG